MNVKKILYEDANLQIVGISLPTVDRASQIPYRLRKYHGLWWLQDKGNRPFTSVVSFSTGKYFKHGADVETKTIYVRPLLRLQTLKNSNFQIGDEFVFGDKRFEIISNGLAFCKEDIGMYPFKLDWKSENANDYSTSDVKKYIEKWFSNVNKT